MRRRRRTRSYATVVRNWGYVAAGALTLIVGCSAMYLFAAPMPTVRASGVSGVSEVSGGGEQRAPLRSAAKREDAGASGGVTFNDVRRTTTLSIQTSAPPPEVATAHSSSTPAAAPKHIQPQSETSTFDGRKLRKVREMTMLVTAYSPDAKSCGASADGITASGYSVWTNGMKMVAADTRLLPFGTIVTVDGYNGDRPVQVLDRGGKIKGRHLDVLFPTDAEARQWGVRHLKVTIWAYADGSSSLLRR